MRFFDGEGVGGERTSGTTLASSGEGAHWIRPSLIWNRGSGNGYPGGWLLDVSVVLFASLVHCVDFVCNVFISHSCLLRYDLFL